MEKEYSNYAEDLGKGYFFEHATQRVFQKTNQNGEDTIRLVKDFKKDNKQEIIMVYIIK